MNSLINFLLFGVIYFILIWKSSKVYPILYLFLFTYFLQYIFSSYLIYNDYHSLLIQMPVGQAQYFDYAIPAMLCLFGGLFVFNRDFDISVVIDKIDERSALHLGFLLLGVSYTFDVLGFIGISFVGSIGSFTTYLKYSGAFCLLFTRHPFRYVFIGIVFIELALIALRAGVFINFFIWNTYLFFFIALKFKYPFWLRFGFVFIAAPILILVQSIKHEYREATWDRQKETGVELFAELAQEKAQKDDELPFSQGEGVVNTVGRLTQGWHLGLTLRHVPKKEPIAQGAEIWSDIVSSILPRVFFADKKTTGSQEKFFKYTGHKLHGNTSMTIGVLGDFYINFGFGWSLFFLFIFGAVVAKLLRYFMMKYVMPAPINIVWVPYFLNYLIRAGNDFYTVFNCLIKGFIIFLFIKFLQNRIWPTDIFKTR